MLAGLGYEASPKNLSGDALLTQLTIAVIGYNARDEFFEQFIAIIKDPKRSDATNQEASKAVGKIVARYPDKYLSVLLSQLEERQKFLLLVAIKEFVRDSKTITDLLLKLEERLFSYCELDNESFLNLLSECIGRIVGLSLKDSQDQFLPKSNDSHNNVKFVFANAYRSFFAHGAVDTSALRPYIAPLLNLLSDSSLQVRSAVLKSLNVVLYYHAELLKPYLTEKVFLDHLSNALAFDPNNIEEVQIGSLIERIDRGKPMRLDGFSLLETLIEKILPMDNEPMAANVLSICVRTLGTC